MNQIQMIAERVMRRREKYLTTIQRWFPKEIKIEVPVKVGHYSMTDISGPTGSRCRRIITQDSIAIANVIETPTAIARDYLAVNQYRPKRLRGKMQYESSEKIMARSSLVPGFANPSRFEEGEYIDLQAAYFSIMSLIGWDCVYCPGRIFALGRSIKDFPFPQHRISRNTLLSTAQPPTFCTMYPPGGSKFSKMKAGWSETVNLQLVAAVSDILQAIANLAISAGAVYVATDGYIAPNLESSNKIKNMISDFGLNARVKAHGPGSIIGAGAYRVGSLETINYKKRRSDHASSNVASMELSHEIWIQKNLAYAASRY